MKGGMYEKRKGKIDTRMQEGREERKYEKKEGSIPQVSGKGPKNPTSTPESTKKVCQNRSKWCQNRPKRVPKRNQDRQKIRATSSRRSWAPLGGDFPAIPSQLGNLLESKIEPNSKKHDAKIVDFLIGLRSRKSKKKEPKTIPKWSPRWSKIEPRRKVKRKMGKV